MSTRPSFDDEVLGRVSWNGQDGVWEFDAGPINGRSVPGRYAPGSPDLPPAEQGWADVRACVLWARAHEPAARDHVMRSAPEAGPRPLWLICVNVSTNREARLVYAGPGLAVSVRVTPR